MLCLRAAAAADHDALQAIYLACRADAAWLPVHARSNGDLAHDAYGETMVLAEDAAGSVRGFVSAWLPDAFVHHLYVGEAWRRQGVASMLLAALRGCAPSPWQLKCLCTNREALRFYDRLGWRPVGSGEDDDGRHLVLQSPPDEPAPGTR